jgi:hypothetical protein
MQCPRGLTPPAAGLAAEQDREGQPGEAEELALEPSQRSARADQHPVEPRPSCGAFTASK